MPERDFYLLIILSVVTGFVLIQIVMARIDRRRRSRRLEREIAEYLRKRAAGQNNGKQVESMARKVTYEQALVAHGWVALDPADTGVIEKLFKKDIREGEEKLMLAVLEEAVKCFQDYVLSTRPLEQRLFQEAEEWLIEKDSEYLYSFENICETLGLHPHYIRQGLLVWKEAQVKLSAIEGHHPGRAKVSRTRIKHTSMRLSKTG